MEATRTDRERPRPTPSDGSASRPRKALTIGAVCKVLGQEFDDISISKIRYLEDQKLLSPRRTSGGYRLYSQADVERLRSILRMQRDEFLPLRVIRQELAAGDLAAGRKSGAPPRRAIALDAQPERIGREELMRESGISSELLRELEEFKLLRAASARDGGEFDETDVEIARQAAQLAEHGIRGRNLRVFLTSADREAALIEQVLAPSLRSNSAERRREAQESLEGLATVCSQLRHLLLVRDLRELT